MTQNRTENSAEHHELSVLLPWYVNETLGRAGSQRVEAHLEGCAGCRDDLAVQQRICEAMKPSRRSITCRRVAQALCRRDSTPQAERLRRAALAPPQALRTGMPWRGWMAASVAVMAVAVALLAADRWLQVEARLTQPKYRTVTTARRGRRAR